MKLPLHFPRNTARRTKRGLALLCALVLVSSNALAALGVCVAKASPAPRSAPAAATTDAPCPQHVADADAAGNPATGERLSAAHCPQDDPGAQTRAADLPTGDWLAAPSCTPLDIAPREIVAARAAFLDYAPPEPLYARLSRLLL